MTFDFLNQVEEKSDEELLKIYSNYDLYQEEYIDIVSAELNKRGVDFSNLILRRQHKDAFMQQRLEKGVSGNPIYITLGFISAILGGFLGIVAGYVYSQSKNKEWGDGSYYYYDLKTRNLGTGMMLLGIAVLLVSIVLAST